MSTMGTSSVHNEWVKPIKSHNQEVITWLDEFWVDVNLVGLTFFNMQAHSISEEVNVCFFHIWRSMRANVWDQWMVRQATNESF